MLGFYHSDGATAVEPACTLTASGTDVVTLASGRSLRIRYTQEPLTQCMMVERMTILLLNVSKGWMKLLHQDYRGRRRMRSTNRTVKNNPNLTCNSVGFKHSTLRFQVQNDTNTYISDIMSTDLYDIRHGGL